MLIPWSYIIYLKYFIFGLFSLAVFIQLIYYWFVYARLIFQKRIPKLKVYPVSVIICARNEAHNLRANLKSVLEQEHRNYEVIVVNDCSTDDTDEVLGEYLKKYKHLRVTSIAPDKKFSHGKKLALTVGIKAARHEWLVLTDADCAPVSNQWLNRLQENFSDNTEIVLGYGGYVARKGFVNAYIRYDTVFIAMQYLGFALAGTPYKGVGRNLAYQKSLFFKNKGFASHYGLISGDDDLFVNETANALNTAVEFHPESHTLSIPKLTWNEFFRQKKRHFTTSGRYRSSHIFKLGMEPFSRLLFYVTFCYLLAFNILAIPVLIIAGVRIITQLIIFKISMHRLSVHGILMGVLLFDLLSLFINFNIYLTSIFRRRRTQWK